MPQARPVDRYAQEKRSAKPMKLTSSAFADGATIPRRYTADGENLSPPLTWNEGPPGTKGYALVCEDPDAPSGFFVHWLVWDIAPMNRELRENLPKAGETNGVLQGENGFGRIGWGGPSPPRGKPHRYVFRLYAVDEKPPIGAGATRDELEDALEGHVLAEAMVIGMYGR